jgi:cobalt/nickel transport system permease protein
MHHVLVDRWSRGASPLHALDPRVKILALLVFLVVLATTAPNAFLTLTIYAALLLAGILIGGLPPGTLLLRALAVLPFSSTFAAISWLVGDQWRAIGLIEKCYLSAVAVLLVVSTTPLPRLFTGLESLGTPRLLVLVAQFLHRYLFVISEQAQHMRIAAAARQGMSGGRRRPRFHAAAGALAVLFAHSYYRAEGINQAMLARGFSGKFALLKPLRLKFADGLFLLAIVGFLIVVRVQ